MTSGVNDEHGPDGWSEYVPSSTWKLNVPVEVVVRTPWTRPFRRTTAPATGCPEGSRTVPLTVNAPDVAPLFWAVPPQLGPEPGPKLTCEALADRLLRFATGCWPGPLNEQPSSETWTVP